LGSSYSTEHHHTVVGQWGNDGVHDQVDFAS
jgi:hypothetical protein